MDPNPDRAVTHDPSFRAPRRMPAIRPGASPGPGLRAADRAAGEGAHAPGAPGVVPGGGRLPHPGRAPRGRAQHDGMQVRHGRQERLRRDRDDPVAARDAVRGRVPGLRQPGGGGLQQRPGAQQTGRGTVPGGGGRALRPSPGPQPRGPGPQEPPGPGRRLSAGRAPGAHDGDRHGLSGGSRDGRVRGGRTALPGAAPDGHRGLWPRRRGVVEEPH